LEVRVREHKNHSGPARNLSTFHPATSPITKTVKSIVIAALTLVAAISARATPVFTDILDPSPSQGTSIIIHHDYGLGFQSSLNGTEFNGQSVQLDLLFNGYFIRAFTQTQKLHTFQVDMFLPYLPFWTTVTPPPDSPSVSGTATLLDALGHPIGSPTPLDQGLDGGPSIQPDVQLLFRPDFANIPVDIYGVRYNLQLSDSPGKMFAIAPRKDIIDFGGFFGVGPRLPADVVPDAGSTLGLLLCGVAACAAFKRARWT